MATKEDLITQIDADLEAKTEPEGVLRSRRKAVNAAKTEAAAVRAYHDHLEETRVGERATPED